tara:strand:+ start:144 stop:1181 length:1038 start_codon:yes stop_codon:yes gene_type:complete
VLKRIKIKSSKVIYNVEIGYKTYLDFTDDSFFIVDKNLFKYSHIRKFNINNRKIIKINPNEKVKEFSEISKVINKLIKIGIKKKSTLYVIGGGILQDIGGFISSILFRGINWKFIPTTLLSQGDSCIGSKTSINFKEYKNQIGTFYPPSEIKIDLNFLKSLKKKDILSGLGEISHYIIIGGNKSFNLLENELRKKNLDYNKIIYASLNIKKSYIEKDEFDKNIRNILNYGHTFGHAIESATNYKIPHGVAVAIGIDISNFFSLKYNLMSNKLRLRIQKTLKKIYNKIDKKSIDIKKVMKAIQNDKKANKNHINLIICVKFGKMIIKKVKLDNKFITILKSYFENL